MRRKVAFISEHASPLSTLGGVDSGGQNVYVAELCKQLVALNYEVDVYTRKEHASQEEVVEWLPYVRVIHIRAGEENVLPKEALLPLMDDFSYNMLRFIYRNNIDYEVMHAHFFMSAYVASKIKKALQIPYVVTFHALGAIRELHQKEDNKFPKERINIEKLIVQDADRIIAECPQDRDDLVTYYKADLKKITLIPCGVNLNEFYPINKYKAREILGLANEDKVLLQLGRMVPRKGVDNVIRSLSYLKNDFRNVKLLVVGGSSDNCLEMQRLKQVAVENNVVENVHFVGSKNREVLKYYYAASDIFISTPWYEPFGITPLEAMACGTPVIGSNVGGIKYSVKPGINGYLVPPSNPQALAEKACYLLSNEKLLNEMRLNAVEVVKKHFTWKQVAELMHKTYSLTLERYKKTGAVYTLQRKKESLLSSIALPKIRFYEKGSIYR